MSGLRVVDDLADVRSVVIAGELVAFGDQVRLRVTERPRILRGREMAIHDVRTVDRTTQAYLELPFRRGFLITTVKGGSSGDKAGLIPGDIILETNGRPVNTGLDFRNIIEEDLLKAGDELEMKIWRDGEEMVITMQLGR